jgi:carotenoid cleavage dioxygenase-like enzyme
MALADAIKVLEDGDFKTMGRVNYGSPIDYLTAHPKIDPVTGSINSTFNCSNQHNRIN